MLLKLLAGITAWKNTPHIFTFAKVNILFLMPKASTFSNTLLLCKLAVHDTDLQSVLSIQRPGAEHLLGRARNAPQTAGVKGQTHDWLRVGLDSAQHRPLGYIPQEQGAVLVSSQQERPRTGGRLGGGGISVRGEEGRRERERRQRRVCEGGEKPQERQTVQRLSCWKLLPTLRRTQQVPFIRPSRTDFRLLYLPQVSLRKLLTLLLICISALLHSLDDAEFNQPKEGNG